MPSDQPSPSRTAGTGVPLHLRGLTKKYQDFVGVDNLNLDIQGGELVALLGPSGCGKTTTLRMVAGLIPVTSGEILVGGRDVTSTPTYQRDMGLVFQSYALFPHMTIAQNVAFGLEMRGIGKDEIKARVRDALRMVHLEGKEDRKPTQLSGGQQQRDALARALVVRPSILLLDEPLSNLDAKLRDEMRREIREIQQKTGITALFVTHDQVEALAMCDKIVVMQAGKLMQAGTPREIYEAPANPFVASFVGRANRLTARGDGSGRYGLSGVEIRGSAGISGNVTMMIRPHRITINDPAAAGENGLSGRLTEVTYVGDLVQLEVASGDQTIMVERSTRSQEALPTIGESVSLNWSAADTMVFSEDAP